MVENSCCHGAEISKCAETKIFYTFFSGDENYGGNFGININRNFRLTWSSYLPRATRMSIMKKITENTWRKKVFFRHCSQCRDISSQSFEREISCKPINHSKWDKSPQTKALSIQSQTQVENSFFYCCVNVVLVMSWRPGKCRDRVQPPTGNDQFDLFINFCSRWNGSLL